MSRPDRSRWSPTLVLAIAATSAAVLPLASGVDEDALRIAIRATAGLAAVVFCVVFATSSLLALLKTDWTKWLMRHRRALGVGFAACMAIHLVVVLLLAMRHADRFWATTATTSIVGGGIGYLWLGTMTITSFDGAARAIGRRAWTVLHTSGVWAIWVIFAFSYLAQPISTWRHVVLVVLLLVAPALRVAARVRRWARPRG